MRQAAVRRRHGCSSRVLAYRQLGVAGANLALVASLAAALVACSGEGIDGTRHYLTAAFPDDFVWGSATAGFQSDMGCPSGPCLDTRSDWYQWVRDPEIQAEGFAHGDRLEDSAGQWELVETDLDRAVADMGHNGYRMSIEWSRVFPLSTEAATDAAGVAALADPAAVVRYHQIFAAIRERGITPLVTLNHYTLPIWLHDGVACHKNIVGCRDRGWLDGDRLIAEMVKYAAFVAHEFGEYVDLWGTINEPFAIILAGYAVPAPSERTNPPGIKDLQFRYAATVLKNMILAHARLYDAVHANDTVDVDGDGVAAMVGFIPNLAAIKVDRPNTAVGQQAAANAFHLYNRYMLDALVNGDWDPNFDGVADEVRADLKGRMDFVGINYYVQLPIAALDFSLVDAIPLFTFLPDPFNLGSAFPPGIYEVTMFVAESYGLPIYITENPLGVPALAWLRRAMAEGADVRGYFNWTLVDQYEWNHGFATSGLYSFDRVTKQRTARPAVPLYRQIIHAGRLTRALIEAEIGEWMPDDASLD